MKCPYCGHLEDKVIDSRPAEDGSSIRRRRECLSCATRFTTYEKVEMNPLLVVKKDSTRQVYSQEKLLGGLLRACEKRPVSHDQLMSVVNYVESQIANNTKREISTTEIGELVMEQLKAIDDVAYVRFASVYKEFKDVESFNTMIAEMAKNTEKKGT
ncbi:MAG: transcriptional repressor NrdR [Clostridiales bacterium]|nr:transcriptional repressor NrdR [Clostridiales bacterium]